MLRSLLITLILFAAEISPLAALGRNDNLNISNAPSFVISSETSFVIPSEAKESLVVDQSWVPYPAYADREGWSSFLGEYQDILVAKGEKYLDFAWVTITTEDYMAYETRGDRHQMEDKQEANTDALSSLFIAELAEGKGRFLPDIGKGVSWFCNAPSWVLSAHLAKYQKSKSPVPDPDEVIMDLYSGNISQLLSWIHYYLGGELGPELTGRLCAELHKRELDPFLQRDDYWWMGFVPRPGKVLNNWTPWCNQNALLCFMLLENDRETLARAVEKSMRSVNLWIESLQSDGACDEGPTYWYKSVGHLLDYLENLERVTGGKVSYWDDPFIQRLGEFIVNADIGDCWQVNFADGSPSRRPISYWIYRYGRASGNRRMMDFAANSYLRYGSNPEDVDWTLFYQGLEAVKAVREMKGLTPSEYIPAPFVCYPETDVCFIRSGKAFLAAKGGSNFERHNHNDVGTCIYFYDNKPVLVDAGVGTYTRDTFGEGRYRNWFIRSSWHNLPEINGCEQPFGEEFKAAASRAGNRRFATDIAGAYPDSAGVKSWTVSYSLKRGGSLAIKEKFSLKAALKPSVLHFLVSDKPVLAENGSIELAGGLVMKYNPKVLTASIEEKSLEGLGFSDRWGKALYRINLTANEMPLKGTYKIRFIPPVQESIPQLTKRVANVASLQFALMDERLADNMVPRTLNGGGTTIKDSGIGSWISGFFSGSLWLLYDLTGDPSVMDIARKETAKLAPILSFPISHDIGFQVNCSYGNAYMATGEEQYLPLIEQGAAALAGRFNPKVGATLSWTAGERGVYPVIIDNMMNLELLEFAGKKFHCDSLLQIADIHAETTLKNHFRPDATTWHMLDYNPETGEILRRVTVQGYSDDSVWSRGQAWGLYGYTMMFRETGKEEYLAQAEKIARMLLSKLPADGIPWWDFSDPEIPFTYRDASAGAIMSSAFIELSTLTRDKALAKSCFAMAERQIRTLASPEYLAEPGTNGNFLLKHSVGNLPGGAEIDVPLTYADYYFLEALCRYRSCMK